MTTTATAKPVETQALTAEGRGQNSREQADEVANVTVGTGNAHEEPMDLLSAVLGKPNMWKAYERVLRNKGAAGVDGVEVWVLKIHLQEHWTTMARL